MTALSRRYTHLLKSTQGSQSAAEQAVAEDHLAKGPDEGDRDTFANSQAVVAEPAVRATEAVSSWQLVLPGYEFSGGSLRAKTAPADAASKSPNGISRADEPLVTPSSDLAVEAQKKQAKRGTARSLGIVGVGLSVGCLLALVGFRLGEADAQRKLPHVDPAIASAPPPCPPTPITSALNLAPSKELLPVSLAPAPDVTSEVAASSPVEEGPSENAAPMAAAPAEVTTSVMSANWRKSKPRTKTRIEMETRQVLVSGRAVAAVILLKRTGSKHGRTRVRWKTLPGTAAPAKDYEGASSTVQFADGQAQRTIFVPILQQSPGAQSRTFSVVLERAPHGSALGSVTSTTVTIMGDG